MWPFSRKTKNKSARTDKLELRYCGDPDPIATGSATDIYEFLCQHRTLINHRLVVDKQEGVRFYNLLSDNTLSENLFLKAPPPFLEGKAVLEYSSPRPLVKVCPDGSIEYLGEPPSNDNPSASSAPPIV